MRIYIPKCVFTCINIIDNYSILISNVSSKSILCIHSHCYYCSTIFIFINNSTSENCAVEGERRFSLTTCLAAVI